MLGLGNFEGDGLYGNHSVAFDLAGRGKASGADNSAWITQFEGTQFKLIPGADPICGHTIPGKSVSASS